jgi:single-strand DNA-binding protein
MSNNTITLVGYVDQEPKTVSFGDTGNKVVKFSVRIKEYSSKTEKKYVWFDVDAWNGLGDRVLQYVTKGREIKVDGRMILSTYKKEVNGKPVEWPKAHIKLSDFLLCGPKPASAEETKTEEPQPEEPAES